MGDCSFRFCHPTFIPVSGLACQANLGRIQGFCHPTIILPPTMWSCPAEFCSEFVCASVYVFVLFRDICFGSYVHQGVFVFGYHPTIILAANEHLASSLHHPSGNPSTEKKT